MAAKKTARAGTKARVGVAKKATGRTTKKPLAKAAKKAAARTAKKLAATAATKKPAATQRAAKAAKTAKTAKTAKKPVGKTVAEYVAALPAAQQHAAAAIRVILQELAPEASESIKWGQPVYEQGGPFAFMKTAKAHLTFGFWRGTELSDPDGLLQGAGDRMRHMKISGNDVPSDAIRAFVGQAILLNAERGDPTRRG